MSFLFTLFFLKNKKFMCRSDLTLFGPEINTSGVSLLSSLSSSCLSSVSAAVQMGFSLLSEQQPPRPGFVITLQQAQGQAGSTGRNGGGQIDLGDKGTMAAQVASRLVMEWPLQASLEASPPLPCTRSSSVHSWLYEMRQQVDGGGGQLRH